MENNLLILGASSDLATALIPRIAMNYRTIFAHYHSSAEKLMEMRKVLTCEMKLLKADFTNEDETRQLIDKVAESGTEITHILHCPSARVKSKHFRKLTWNDYSAMLDTQLRSLFYASSRFVPEMSKRRNGKVVVVISSYTCGTPPAFANAYISAKYAQLGFVKSLAAEYAGKSVQINAVSPSMMETKFLSEMPPHAAEQNAATQPMGRNATVDDVLPAIEFLLSDRNNFITGQNLLISGGSVI